MFPLAPVSRLALQVVHSKRSIFFLSFFHFSFLYPNLPHFLLIHPFFLKFVSLDSFLLLSTIVRSRGSSVSIVSGYGLDDRAIEVRSPAEAKRFFL
jgi:hypothetical protein